MGGRVSALSSLVEKGLVAPDWAEALAPVDERIAAMGRFLRAEIAAGRGCLPAGDHILRAFSRPLADDKVLVVGQDPTAAPVMERLVRSALRITRYPVRRHRPTCRNG